MNPKRVEDPVRVCVVLPTYNNGPTIEGVIRSITGHFKDLIVVDDGSTDGAGEMVRRFSTITVLRNESNRGKGVALARGLAEASRQGFTHALSLDGDGQHAAEDLPRMEEAVRRWPKALILGRRCMPRGKRPLKSRVLRLHSNFWTWVLTGKWLSDTQSGFRAYPLEGVLPLSLSTRRYDYEIEILVRALWTGVPVREIDIAVRYDTASHSHFRPIKDFALVALLNTRLFLERIFLPDPIRKKRCVAGKAPGGLRRALLDALGLSLQSPLRFAAAVGIGLFMGIAPIWGFQMAAAFLAARLLGLSAAVSLAASNISFPAAIPFILYASLLCGRFLLTGEMDTSLACDGTTAAVAWDYATEYLAGSLVLAFFTGLVGGGLAYWTALSARMLRRRRR